MLPSGHYIYLFQTCEPPPLADRPRGQRQDVSPPFFFFSPPPPPRVYQFQIASDPVTGYHEVLSIAAARKRKREKKGESYLDQGQAPIATHAVPSGVPAWRSSCKHARTHGSAVAAVYFSLSRLLPESYSNTERRRRPRSPIDTEPGPKVLIVSGGLEAPGKIFESSIPYAAPVHHLHHHLTDGAGMYMCR